MTEKRFTFEIKTKGNKAYTQWYDNGKPINSAETIVDLLNELVEEKQQLINDCGILIQSNQDYRKENEQLKCNETVNEINKIWSDNNELKQLNIPIEEIKETVTDYQGRITAIYYKE